IPAYNSNGLGLLPLKDLPQEAAELVDEGFRAVKLRVGRSTAKEDREALRAVKSAVGPGVTLMVDFNQGLTVAQALERGRMIDDEGGVHWIEEPVRADDFAGTARVRDEVKTPIQIGENFRGPEQMAQALAAGACDYVMPDAERIGGVTGWMRAAALAQAAGLEMSSHLFPEVSAHLLAVTPTAHWLEYVDWANPILETPFSLQEANIAATAARHPERAAIDYYGRRIAYRDLKREVDALAGFLQQRCGVKRGDRVLLYLQNSPQFVIAYYAVLRA